MFALQLRTEVSSLKVERNSLEKDKVDLQRELEKAETMRGTALRQFSAISTKFSEFRHDRDLAIAEIQGQNNQLKGSNEQFQYRIQELEGQLSNSQGSNQHLVRDSTFTIRGCISDIVYVVCTGRHRTVWQTNSAFWFGGDHTLYRHSLISRPNLPDSVALEQSYRACLFKYHWCSVESYLRLWLESDD